MSSRYTYKLLEKYNNLSEGQKHSKEAVKILVKSLNSDLVFENCFYLIFEFFHELKSGQDFGVAKYYINYSNKKRVIEFINIVQLFALEFLPDNQIYPFELPKKMKNETGLKLSGENFNQLAECINFVLKFHAIGILDKDDFDTFRVMRELIINKAISMNFLEAKSSKSKYYFLDYQYYKLHNIPVDTEMEEIIFINAKEAVEAGVESAYYYLGLCYKHGIATEMNPLIAIDYLEKSMSFDKLGLKPELITLFGLYYQVGSYDQAIKCLEIGVDLGKMSCKYNLAYLKSEGIVTGKNIEQSIQLLKQIIGVEKPSRDDLRYVYLAYSKLSDIYLDLGNYKESLSYLKEIQGQHVVDGVSKRIKNIESIICAENSTSNYTVDKVRYEEELKLMYGKCFDLLQNETKEMLINAEILYKAISDQFELIDYSPVLLSLFKALEIELNANFYRGYSMYVHKIPMNYPTYKKIFTLENGRRIRKENTYKDFTLGKLREIVYLGIEVEYTEFIKSGFYFYVKNFYYNKEAGLKSDLFLFNHISSIVETVERIRIEYRNPALHSKKMDLIHVEQCRNYFYSIKKIIYSILEYRNPDLFLGDIQID